MTAMMVSIVFYVNNRRAVGFVLWSARRERRARPAPVYRKVLWALARWRLRILELECGHKPVSCC